MNAPAAPACGRRPPPHLRHALAGVWRLTFPGFVSARRLLTLAAALAGLALLTLATTRAGTAAAFFEWVIRFYLAFLLPVLAFVAGAGALRDDLKPATVDFVFTRPIPRPVFVVFRYLAHLAGSAAYGFLALGVLLGVGWFRQVPGLWGAVPLLLLAQVMAAAVFTSFGFLCGALTARYLVVGLAYAGVVEVGLGNIPTPLSRLSLTHQLQGLLQPLVAGGHGSPAAAMATVATLLLVTVVMLAVAAVLFGQRELAGGKPKEA